MAPSAGAAQAIDLPTLGKGAPQILSPGDAKDQQSGKVTSSPRFQAAVGSTQLNISYTLIAQIYQSSKSHVQPQLTGQTQVCPKLLCYSLSCAGSKAQLKVCGAGKAVHQWGGSRQDSRCPHNQQEGWWSWQG